MAAPPGAAGPAGEERALALLAPAASGDDAAAAGVASLAAALQELVCTTFDPPSVDSDEAIARALAEEEEEARRRHTPKPPEDVSRDVAVALACQLDEISRAAPALPVGLPPEQPGAGVDAAVEAALDGSGLKALPWALGAPPPPPSADGRAADLARLRQRLHTYGLEEGVVQGDGNCQFRALADQLYRSEKYHAPVRAAVCAALAAQPDRFAPYVVGDWAAYLASAAVDGTWGDHVTLQAAADAYGVRVCVITTYESSGYLEVAPLERRSERSLWLSLHAEVHYNSIYPAGEVPKQGLERVRQLEADATRGVAERQRRSS